MGCYGVQRTRARPPTFHRRLRSLTLRQRLTRLWTWSIRSRGWWSAWFATGCSRVSACHKSRETQLHIRGIGVRNLSTDTPPTDTPHGATSSDWPHGTRSDPLPEHVPAPPLRDVPGRIARCPRLQALLQQREPG